MRWCDNHYPDDLFLTQEMIDQWCSKRPTELNTTHAARIRLVNCLIKFINERSQDEHLFCVTHERCEKAKDPALFEENELVNFFRALDELPVSLGMVPTCRNERSTYLKALEAPVYFRLLFSSGMRPIEVRELDRKDVDLGNGIIHIRHTKGYNERLVALHETTRMMLVDYDHRMQSYMHDRKTFFPDFEDKYHHKGWEEKIFRMCWDKYNPKHDDEERNVVAYSLRHNYAIENINSWHGDNVNIDIRMMSLSKSMGHSSVKETEYYFHFVPRCMQLIEELSGEAFDDILSNITYEKEL